MHLFKQHEASPDSVLQMSIALCNECPESPACKRYMQWLRLNAVKKERTESNLDFDDMPVIDRPYYRSRSEEVFW